MKFYLAAGIILLILLLLPWIRIFLKRIHLFMRLRSVCKKNFKLVGIHFFWPFGRNQSKNHDFTIETSNKIIAVKLFSVRYPRASLIFLRQGGYRIRRHFPLRGKTVLPIDSKYKEMNYRFEKGAESKEDNKEVVPVLLIHPNGKEILYQTAQNDYRAIDPGEAIHGMMVFSFPEFAGWLNANLNKA